MTRAVDSAKLIDFVPMVNGSGVSWKPHVYTHHFEELVLGPGMDRPAQTVSFLGDTTAGKSHLLRSLLPDNPNIDKPYVINEEIEEVPGSTTSGVHLYWSGEVGFCDFEGSMGGVPARHASRLATILGAVESLQWTTGWGEARRIGVGRCLPPIAYTISHVLVYVTTSKLINATTYEALMKAAQLAKEGVEIAYRPSVVVIQNRCSRKEMKNSEVLTDIFKRHDEGGQNLSKYFHTVECLCIPEDDNPIFQDQIEVLKTIIQRLVMEQVDIQSRREQVTKIMWLQLVPMVVRAIADGRPIDMANAILEVNAPIDQVCESLNIFFTILRNKLGDQVAAELTVIQASRIIAQESLHRPESTEALLLQATPILEKLIEGSHCQEVHPVKDGVRCCTPVYMHTDHHRGRDRRAEGIWDRFVNLFSVSYCDWSGSARVDPIVQEMMSNSRLRDALEERREQLRRGYPDKIDDRVLQATGPSGKGPCVMCFTQPQPPFLNFENWWRWSPVCLWICPSCNSTLAPEMEKVVPRIHGLQERNCVICQNEVASRGPVDCSHVVYCEGCWMYSGRWVPCPHCPPSWQVDWVHAAGQLL